MDSACKKEKNPKQNNRLLVLSLLLALTLCGKFCKAQFTKCFTMKKKSGQSQNKILKKAETRHQIIKSENKESI